MRSLIAERLTRLRETLGWMGCLLDDKRDSWSLEGSECERIPGPIRRDGHEGAKTDEIDWTDEELLRALMA